MPERGAGLALLAEVLLVGVLTLPALLLVVPLPAAVAAGSAHLRRHVSGLDDGLRRLWREAFGALRPLLPAGFALLAVVVVGTIDLLAARSGELAGSAVVTPVTVLVLTATTVLALRAGAAWSDATGEHRSRLAELGEPAAPPGARALGRVAWSRSRSDPSGSLLLASAVGAVPVLVWAVPALVVVASGLLCVAVVGVEERRLSRTPDPPPEAGAPARRPAPSTRSPS